MCGIAGIYAPGQRVALEEIRDLMAPMAHRGPDDSGVKMLSGGELGLGHLRLAILDISPSGHQPMGSPDGKVWVVFNGEIYNFRELRETLEHGGCRFVTNSDTEVLVAAFCRWGLDCVKQFHGMFAFGLWDDRSHQLHLCRDRFGVKPLFYALRNGRVTFASELKALNLTGATDRRFDPTSIAEFLHYGYVSSPRTIFDDVRTVTPGTAISFGRSLQPSVEQYWSTTDLLTGKQHLDLSTRIGALPTEELLDLAESHLERAFKRRMVSDVPVGLFLSGGIDSSLVAAVLARRCGITPKTFTVGFGASESTRRITREQWQTV